MSPVFLRFVVVGVIGFFFDGGGSWLLVHRGVDAVVARVAPLAAAIVVTWLLHRNFTFRIRRSRSRAEAIRYATVALSSTLMNFLIYSALVRTGIHPFLAVAAATLVMLFCNFFAYRTMVFR